LPSRVTVVRSAVNRGIAATKNAGLRLLAHCDYIMLSDCDAVFKKGWDKFYIERMEQTGLPSVSLSNIFNDTTVVKAETINGIKVEFYKKFQGVFLVVRKDAYEKLGGMPLLPEKYGQERYNWQVRAGRLAKWGDVVADFVGSKAYIITDDMRNSFINNAEKVRQSIKNAEVSDRILRSGVLYMPPEIEYDKEKRGDNVCIAIGHRNSTPDRLSNTKTVIDYYKSIAPNAEVMLIEQDATPALQETLRKDVRYVHAYNKGSYNRSWAFNIAAKLTDRPVLFCMDNDVLLKSHTFYHAVNEKVGSGEFEIYKPYWWFLDLPLKRTHEFKNNGFKFQWADNTLHIRCPHIYWMMGGCVCVNRKKFLEIGGYNEKFRGWGGEDDEFSIRARALANTGKVANGELYDFNLYHLFHNRTQDCTENQPGYQANVAELRKVEAMTPDQIRRYANDNLMNQGNLDKYRNE
jgi:GT2 family glycosyltransferase